MLMLYCSTDLPVSVFLRCSPPLICGEKKNKTTTSCRAHRISDLEKPKT